MHILAPLGIGQVFTTAGFAPFRHAPSQTINDLHHENSSTQGRIRQVGLEGTNLERRFSNLTWRIRGGEERKWLRIKAGICQVFTTAAFWMGGWVG